MPYPYLTVWLAFQDLNSREKQYPTTLNVLDHDVYFQVTDLLLDNNIPQVLISLNNIMTKGFEGHHFIIGLASHFRDLLVAKDAATIELSGGRRFGQEAIFGAI